MRTTEQHLISFIPPKTIPFADLHTIVDNSPWTQVTILGCVTFCSVGMYSAVSGLGAGYVKLKPGHAQGRDSVANDAFSTVVPKTHSSLTRQMAFSTAALPSLASLLVPSTYVVLQRPLRLEVLRSDVPGV